MLILFRSGSTHIPTSPTSLNGCCFEQCGFYFVGSYGRFKVKIGGVAEVRGVVSEVGELGSCTSMSMTYFDG